MLKFPAEDTGGNFENANGHYNNYVHKYRYWFHV